MVIVILGILAAVAVPKFVDLQSDAREAATQGVAGGVSSAFAVNYAAYAVSPAKGVQVSGTIAAANLNTLAAAMMAGGVPSNFTVTAGAAVTCGTSVGLSNTAAVTTNVGATASAPATLICTG